MPKNNCFFQARWFEDEWFKHRISKKNYADAISNYCCKDVSVPNIESCFNERQKACRKSPFDQCIKSLMPLTPAPTLIILKINFSDVWSFQ